MVALVVPWNTSRLFFAIKLLPPMTHNPTHVDTTRLPSAMLLEEHRRRNARDFAAYQKVVEFAHDNNHDELLVREILSLLGLEHYLRKIRLTVTSVYEYNPNFEEDYYVENEVTTIEKALEVDLRDLVNGLVDADMLSKELPKVSFDMKIIEVDDDE